ncbi:cytochrome P450 2G1-like isoform X2 [Colossoma macropomum]|uniref:cytochrome P450 2G1-like isoform X2 n=1 Tax=Colossoma macropomum TaxID=42526 RepID=UPI001864198D|nr:cytochrome P450 2G1-like isoform X2 [Colossoma macropomum]
MDIFNTLFLAGLVVVLLVVIRWKSKMRRLLLSPGPLALPLLGNLVMLNKRAPFKSFLKWSKTYGPVMTVYLGPQRVVVLVGYDAVKEALVDQADDFAGRASIPFMHRVVKGYGLVISNGDRWRQLRRFTLTTLRDFGMGRRRIEYWIQEESRHLQNSLRETKSAPFDPTFYLSRAVSNVICALVFGQRFSYEDSNLLRLFQIITAILRFGSSPWGQAYNVFPWLMEHLPGRHQTLLREVDELKAFIVEKIRTHKEKDSPETEFHYDNMVSTVLNLFLAGTETTSTTIRYALMLLIKYTHIQEQMQKEIDTVIGTERNSLMQDRKALPFTDAVIHEVQRYLDLVPFSLPHYATHNISFRGYAIPKGTVIIPLLHSVLKDEGMWDNPWTFDPNNFLDANGNFRNNPAFIPFSAGKRSCVGESLARMELFMFIVSLLQHFTFSSPGGPDSVDPTPELSSFGNLPRMYQLIATPR